jgi:hypothetical protein
MSYLKKSTFFILLHISKFKRKKKKKVSLNFSGKILRIIDTHTNTQYEKIGGGGNTMHKETFSAGNNKLIIIIKFLYTPENEERRGEKQARAFFHISNSTFSL